MADILSIFGGFLVSVLLGLVLIPHILQISYRKRLFDLPDTRKVHTVPVPRLGGFSFFPVILVSVCLILGIRHCIEYGVEAMPDDLVPGSFLFLAAGCTLLYLTGIADDLVGVGYRHKFVVQLLTASFLVASGVWIDNLGGLFGIRTIPAWIGMPFTVLLVVYITNAINLIDGIDGLASGLCGLALAAFGIRLAQCGDYSGALIASGTLGVLVPFWFYNVYGNAQRCHKLFMGDAGSLTLGYILSFLAIQVSKTSVPSAEVSDTGLVSAFSPLLVPLLDVVRVVLHRIRTGCNPFMPDRNHIHHKLLRAGLSPRAALFTILCIAFLFVILNALLDGLANITWIVVADLVLWTLLHLFINWRISLNEKP